MGDIEKGRTVFETPEDIKLYGDERVMAERERIVDLLRDYKARLYDDANNSADPAWDIERAEAVESCLALIKGEQNLFGLSVNGLLVC